MNANLLDVYLQRDKNPQLRKNNEETIALNFGFPTYYDEVS